MHFQGDELRLQIDYKVWAKAAALQGCDVLQLIPKPLRLNPRSTPKGGWLFEKMVLSSALHANLRGPLTLI